MNEMCLREAGWYLYCSSEHGSPFGGANANSGIFRARMASPLGGSGSGGDGLIAIAVGDALEPRRDDGSVVTTPVVDRFSDLDRNNRIGAEDALRIIQIATGGLASSPQDSLVADVDGDSGCGMSLVPSIGRIIEN